VGQALHMTTVHVHSASLLALPLAAAALALTTSSPASRQPPTIPLEGRIVFESTRDGAPEIYAMNADGTGTTRLTKDPESDATPAFSTDGTRIVFASSRNGSWDLWRMRDDGTELEQLTDTRANELNPDISSNGELVVFERQFERDTDIYALNVTTREETAIATSFNEEITPSISPDGTRVAYVGRTGSATDFELFNVPVVGGKPRLRRAATTTAIDEQWPAFTPDGKRLVLTRVGRRSSTLATSGPRGLNPRTVKTGGRRPFAPTWSPDTRAIAYTRPDARGVLQIFIHVRETGTERQLTFSRDGRDALPSWTRTERPRGRVAAVAGPPAAFCTIDGTSSGETVDGSNSADTLCGYGGNDKFLARDGHDYLVLGSGNDRAFGHRASDDFDGCTEDPPRKDKIWGDYKTKHVANGDRAWINDSDYTKSTARIRGC
jgi:TolB protein